MEMSMETNTLETLETQVQNRLSVLEKALATSQEALKHNEPVDLTGLDAEVSAVCSLLQALERPRGEQYLDQLQTMANTLGDIASILKQVLGYAV